MNRGELRRLRTGSPAHRLRPSGSAFFSPASRRYPSLTCIPVLFHFGPIVVPSYGVLAALGVLLALMLLLGTARMCGSQSQSVVESLHRCALRGTRRFPHSARYSQLDSGAQSSSMAARLGHGAPPIARGIGAAFALAAALPYMLWQRLPIGPAADALTGADRAGSGLRAVGRSVCQAWATGPKQRYAGSRLYASSRCRWSGAPLFVPVHPVQAYAALTFLTISVSLLLWMPASATAG